MAEQLEKNINNSLFLETPHGRMAFADIFTTSQQLFLVIFYFKIIFYKY